MTAARETIETDEPRLVDPEPENKAETPILEAIERHYCRLDNAHHAFTSNFYGWQMRNDIRKDDLDEGLEQVASAANAMRENIAKLKERRVREPYDVKQEASTASIRAVINEMDEDGYDCRALPGQIERIEATLRELRKEFSITDY